ncbi:MAG: hypothetical protein ACOX8C_17755 [Saccharomonospora viridis]|uniref:Uncharacterized protein n=2 Tax=Saccharomonospora viridis TaxID=1852 RepID=C7MUT8_SACVD|nr:hypothetical protein [Saccharomonospora viridis]ACU95651.1 hypothetical protein Svir_05800 [Saccharomonospora viridis DSM 43017]KHF43863.1 hypothetical protein MINT15_21680 [Saccharomonospora viridis]SFP91975.1 hypothetical protein SAMN02982918_3889 [Saccharomonospora viridis]
MTWLWLTLAGLVLVAGALVPVLPRRERRSDAAETRARSAYLLLGHHVDPPPPAPEGDAETEALFRRAIERWHSAGGVLAEATTREEFALAQRIAEEGLDTVAEAHARLGLPPPAR